MNLFFWKKKRIVIEPVVDNPEGINLSSVSMKDFQRMLKFGKSSDTIGKYKSKAFIELPYGIIKKQLPILQNKDLLLEQVMLILECQFDNVRLSNVGGNDILRFLMWIKEQQQFIHEREIQFLSSEPEPEMIAAGIEQLNKHGEIMTIDSLAQRDILRHKLIEQLPYHEVFKKLLIDKDVREFEKRYAKVLEGKNKGN